MIQENAAYSEINKIDDKIMVTMLKRDANEISRKTRDKKFDPTDLKYLCNLVNYGYTNLSRAEEDSLMPSSDVSIEQIAYFRQKTIFLEMIIRLVTSQSILERTIFQWKLFYNKAHFLMDDYPRAFED